MFAVSAVLSPRCCKTNVSMSVSVQCLWFDVECNDVPTTWCIRLCVIVQVSARNDFQSSAVVNEVIPTRTAKSSAVSKDCQSCL
jgi:hypothetical protein